MQLVAIETAVEDLALYNAWGQYQGEFVYLDNSYKGEN